MMHIFSVLEVIDRSLEPTKSPRSSLCLSELKTEKFITYQGKCSIVEHSVADPQG